MQDKKETTNNMQAYNEPPPTKEEEAKIFFGAPKKLIPNGLTIGAVVVGLSSIKLGLEQKWEICCICILISGILDGLDGPAARALNCASRFGAELDSLCDFVNFGVSPTVLLFLWKFREWDWFGWGICLVYTSCMACRLARFNAGVDFNANKYTRNYFMGVPAPAGAIGAIMPIIATFQFGEGIWSQKEVVAVYLMVVSWGLICTVPTPSSKGINRTLLPKGKKLYFGVLLAIGFSGWALLNFWLFMIVVQTIWLFGLIPTILAFRRGMAKFEEEQKQVAQTAKPKGRPKKQN